MLRLLLIVALHVFTLLILLKCTLIYSTIEINIIIIKNIFISSIIHVWEQDLC